MIGGQGYLERGVAAGYNLVDDIVNIVNLVFLRLLLLVMNVLRV